MGSVTLALFAGLLSAITIPYAVDAGLRQRDPKHALENRGISARLAAIVRASLSRAT
jgi:hypothetical protein